MIHGNLKKFLASLLAAVMVVTSMPYSAYAAENAVFESEMNESQSGEETKMSKETAVEEQFEEMKTDVQEIGQEESTDESITDTVEAEVSTDETQDSKEEPATEILEKDETQTDVEETLEYDETRTDTEEAFEEDEELAAGNGVAAKLEALKSTYPDGKYWWRVDGVNSSVTDSACPSSPKDQYGCCYGTGNCGYYRTRGGGDTYQCVAFAYNLYNLIFGEEPPNYLGNRTDTENIMVGDYVRFKVGHSAIVIGKNENMLVLAESNWRGPCRISWGREYSVSNVSGFCHASNYDEINNLDREKGEYMTTGYYQTIPDGDYHIVSSFGDQWWLTNAGFSMDDGGNVQLWQYDDIECEDHLYNFKFIDGGDGRGFYKITNKLSRKCLDVDGGSEYKKDENGNPTNIQQWTDNGSSAQQWAIREVDGGDKGVMYTFQARCSGFCLDLSGGESNVKSGANISMWEDNGTLAQQWRLIPWAPSVGQTIEDGEYQIVCHAAENKAIGFAGNSPADGVNVELNSYQGDYRQTFQVTYLGKGYYSIINKYSGLSLDVEGGPNIRKLQANIQLWTFDNVNDAQKWIIRSCGNGYYNVISKCSALYLDLESGGIKDGNNINMQKWKSSGTNQQWKFIPYTSQIAVQKLTLNKTTLTLLTGESVTLTAAISPSNATNKTLIWQSSNTSVADVDNSGTVTAKSEGTALITVTAANGKTASCKVTVIDDKDPYGDILKEDIPEDGKIPEGLWIAEIKPQTYTGKAIKPEVRVYDHKTLLKEKKDYTLSYKNNTNASDADGLKPPTIIVTGKGNYKGKEPQTFTISPKNLADTDITADDIVLKENKKVQKPVPTITWNNKKLAKKKDYTISYPNEAADGAYMKTGTYSICVKGVGNYTGERTITLTITQDAVKPSKKTALNKANAELQFDKIAFYTGNAVKPDRYTLTFTTKDAGGNNNTVMLEEGIDYKVSYQNNVKAGKASILFQGINNYSGTLRKNYNIAQYDIEADTEKKIEITLSDAYAYTKGGCRPKPIVMFGKTALTEGADYTLSYQNNTKLSSDGNTEKAPNVIIKGKGNFKGTCKKTFAIVPKDIGTLTLTATDKTWQNKNNCYQTKIIIKDTDQKSLSVGKDYSREVIYQYDTNVTLSDGTSRNAGETVSSQDIIPAGTRIRVIVKADGENYTGTLTGTYRIVKADIGKASVKIPPQIYTGKPIEPDKSQITIKLKGQNLSEED